jgi:hypothetical protein
MKTQSVTANFILDLQRISSFVFCSIVMQGWTTAGVAAENKSDVSPWSVAKISRKESGKILLVTIKLRDSNWDVADVQRSLPTVTTYDHGVGTSYVTISMTIHDYSSRFSIVDAKGKVLGKCLKYGYSNKKNSMERGLLFVLPDLTDPNDSKRQRVTSEFFLVYDDQKADKDVAQKFSKSYARLVGGSGVYSGSPPLISKSASAKEKDPKNAKPAVK